MPNAMLICYNVNAKHIKSAYRKYLSAVICLCASVCFSSFFLRRQFEVRARWKKGWCKHLGTHGIMNIILFLMGT